MSKKAFLDPIVIAQLGNLQLRARRILDGLYSGHHVNVTRGQSQDFSQHRPYNPGDDPKTLDWKAFGRTDRLVVKQYEEQTNVAAVAVLDDSASMNFSYGGRPTKLDYAKTMAAAIGYLVASQHDAIGLLTRERRVPPSASRGHLDIYFEALDAVNGQGVWDISSLTGALGVPLKKRGFLVIFSDLLEDPDKVIHTLRALHAQKHEVLIFQILDPAEKDLPFEGPVLFEDLESKGRLKTDPEALRRAYQKLVEEKINAFTQVFRSSGMDYLCLTTDTPFDKGLGAFLSWRGARI